MKPGGSISIWFFIGISLLVNGALIFVSGVYEYFHPPAQPLVLANLHAGIWWGAILTVLGAIYSFYYNPSRAQT
jgi:hypothetical protein